MAVTLKVADGFIDRVDRAKLRQVMSLAYSVAGIGTCCALSVVITDNAEIQRLNREYRGRDAVTDVLAFGTHSEDGPPVVTEHGLPYLGDIVISFPRTEEQAESYGHSVEEELYLLAVHGLLHLLGHDHEAPGDKEKMWALQARILSSLGIAWSL